MSIASRFYARLLRLPPAETFDVRVERDIVIPMPDGVRLMADHYVPRGSESLPTILVRSPYGRRGLYGLSARLFAERGYQVLIQSCRGTADSEGQFNPFYQERTDGLATVEWMRQQPWYTGKFATYGASYLGYVQWAIAGEVGPELKAIAAQVSSPDARRVRFPGNVFALLGGVSWMHMMAHQTRSGTNVVAMLTSGPQVRAATHHLPLNETDRIAAGRTIPFWQDWLAHEAPNDEWWQGQNHWDSVTRITAPAHLVGGWYDIFLPDTIATYECLRQAGHNPSLIIGPWAHTDRGWMSAGLHGALKWFRAYLKDDASDLPPQPVRLYVMGANEWCTYPDWPIAGTEAVHWYLQAGAYLAPVAPSASEPDHYRFDPAHPTPSLKGVVLLNGGPADHRAVDVRPDVLAYTCAVLDRDVEVIGPVQAELYVRSSLAHTDFFVGVRDVDPSGRSINISDGHVRLRPDSSIYEADGSLHLTITLYPTAHRFKQGHRIRVVISSAAHPRSSLNTGTGEPLATATRLVAADQTIYHDPEHPSAVILSIAAVERT